MKLLCRHGSAGLFAVLLGLLSTSGARADIIFVTSAFGNTVGEYTTSGATVNAALISGLSGPVGLALSGSDLFITNAETGTIGEYTTAGATVNASLISGLSDPEFIAITSTVPEPGTLALLAVGLAGLAFCRRKRTS